MKKITSIVFAVFVLAVLVGCDLSAFLPTTSSEIPTENITTLDNTTEEITQEVTTDQISTDLLSTTGIDTTLDTTDVETTFVTVSTAETTLGVTTEEITTESETTQVVTTEEITTESETTQAVTTEEITTQTDTTQAVTTEEITTKIDTTATPTTEVVEITLILIPNDGTDFQVIILEDFSAYELPVLNREGYAFEGWYLDSELTEIFEENSNILQDLTLYAKWETNIYSINIYNYYTLVQTINLTYGEVIDTNQFSSPTRLGYTFVGYEEELPELMPAYDLDLHAMFEINQYSITYIYNDGRDDVVLFYDYHEYIDEPVEPTREGFIFDGWYDDEDFNTQYFFYYMGPRDEIAYAKWIDIVDPYIEITKFDNGDYEILFGDNDELDSFQLTKDELEYAIPTNNIFTEEGRYTLLVTDNTGNTNYVEFTIDKTAPVIQERFTTGGFTGVSCINFVITDDNLIVVKNIYLNGEKISMGVDTYYGASGLYEVEAIDEFGNEAYYSYLHDVSGPVIEVEYNYDFDIDTLSGTGINESDYFGCSIVSDGNKLFVGAYGAFETGAVYVYDLSLSKTDPNYETIITPTDGKTGDKFGYSIAVQGDLLIVGAPFNDNHAINGGEVYMYDLSLNPSDEGYESNFKIYQIEKDDNVGIDVDIDGYYVVAGCPNRDYNYKYDSGGFYLINIVYNYSEFINPSDSRNFTRYGGSVAIEGMNIAVGSTYGIAECVKLYTITLFNSYLLYYDEEIFTSNTSPYTYFGYDIDLLNNKLFIGSTREFSSYGNCTGLVTIFDMNLDKTNESYKTVLEPIEGEGIIDFGINLHAYENYLLVGPTKQGDLYIYDLSKDPEDENYLIYIDSLAGNQYNLNGISMSGESIYIGNTDCNDLGISSGQVIEYEKIITSVSASIYDLYSEYSYSLIKDGEEFINGESLTFTDNGVYTILATDILNNETNLEFSITNSSPLINQQRLNNEIIQTITETDGYDSDLFGNSVAFSNNRIYIGVPGYGETEEDRTGAVFVYDLRFDPSDERYETILQPDNLFFNAMFGYSIAAIGNSLAVSAPYGGNGYGAIYVYNFDYLTSSSGYLREIVSPDNSYGGFGKEIAYNGEWLIVGDPYSNYGNQNGAVYVYQGTRIDKIIEPVSTANGYWFGSSLALDGDMLVVGYPYSDNGVHNAGAVYIFDLELDETDTDFRKIYYLSNAVENTGFGFDVDISGKLVVVGTTLRDDNKGYAYIIEYTSSYYDLRRITIDVNSYYEGSLVSIHGSRIIVGSRYYNFEGNIEYNGNVELYSYDRYSNDLTHIETILSPGNETTKFISELYIDDKMLIIVPYSDILNQRNVLYKVFDGFSLEMTSDVGIDSVLVTKDGEWYSDSLNVKLISDGEYEVIIYDNAGNMTKKKIIVY